MARRALLVGINEYQSVTPLRGCRNDVRNIWELLRYQLGFRNEDIRVLLDDRATRRAILDRLTWMVDSAGNGDVLVFHFSGHGTRIRDRDGDELRDQMDELICPWDMNWDGTYIVDDDLESIFGRLPDGANLEVFLDCCHSGWDTPLGDFATRFAGQTPVAPAGDASPALIPRFLEPPEDIQYRWMGEEDRLGSPRGFTSENRSTARHIIWAASRPDQLAADAMIDGRYQGVFTYHYCLNMRQTGGNILRSELLERIRAMLRSKNYSQIPEIAVGDPAALTRRSLQFPALAENDRLLFLTSPNMRGADVARAQEALAAKGYDINADGVFGPYTRVVVMKFQDRNGMIVDGVVGPAVRRALFG